MSGDCGHCNFIDVGVGGLGIREPNQECPVHGEGDRLAESLFKAVEEPLQIERIPLLFRNVEPQFIVLDRDVASLSTPTVTLPPILLPPIPVDAKREYVRKAENTRDHGCHAKGCTTKVKPAYVMCPRHWFMVPKHLRDDIWRLYNVGQEEGRAGVSGEYLRVLNEVIWVVAEKEGL